MNTFILQNAATEGRANDFEQSSLTLTILHNRVSFRVTYTAKNFELSPTALQQYCAAFSAIENLGRHHVNTTEDIERLRRPFDKLMIDIAREAAPEQETLGTLRSYVYPLYFELEALINDSGEIVPFFDGSRRDRNVLVPGLHEDDVDIYVEPLYRHIECYSSCEIRVLSCNERAVPSAVSVDDSKYFFKPISDCDHSTLRGLRSHSNILASRTLFADHRICHLRGLVMDDENDVPHRDRYHSHASTRHQNKRLVGLLLDHIDVRDTLHGYIASFNYTKEEKERWYINVCEVVGRLHDRRIVWGNVSPDNVLIDREGQIHLTGFVGRQKGNWVDKDWRHTIEGDERGLNALNAWLFDWERALY